MPLQCFISDIPRDKISSTLSDCLKYSQFSSHDTARADVLYASAQPPPQSNGAGALVVL